MFLKREGGRLSGFTGHQSCDQCTRVCSHLAPLAQIFHSWSKAQTAHAPGQRREHGGGDGGRQTAPVQPDVRGHDKHRPASFVQVPPPPKRTNRQGRPSSNGPWPCCPPVPRLVWSPLAAVPSFRASRVPPCPVSRLTHLFPFCRLWILTLLTVEA